MNLKSDRINQSIEFDVVLPTLSEEAEIEQPYMTLYFLCGYSGGSRETLTFMNMQMFALKHKIALVLVTGDRSFYIDKKELGEEYGKFVGEELVEMTRSLLPLSNKREDTFIGGISMGGYGALINGLHYSQTFEKIIMLSPALEIDKLMNKGNFPVSKGKLHMLFGTEEEHLSSIWNPRKEIKDKLEKGERIPDLFLRCGKEDEFVSEENQLFLKFLEEEELEIDFEETHGNHDLEYWYRMMESAFSFIAPIQ